MSVKALVGWGGGLKAFQRTFPLRMQVFLHMSTLYILSWPSYFSGCGPFAEIQEEYPFYAMDFLQNVSIVIMYQMRLS